MRILLIANFAPDRQESMLRFARLLAGGLREHGHEVRQWAPEPRLVSWLPRYRYGGPSKLVGYIDKFLLFPRRVKRRLDAGEGAADVVHILDHANAVYAPAFSGRPLLVTCHDLLQIRAARGEFPQHRLSSTGRRYQMLILDRISRLPHLAVPSARTGRDLEQIAGIPTDRISVIPMSLNSPLRRVSLAAGRLQIGKMLGERRLAPGTLEHGGRGFLLNVGGGQWYKNRPGLIEIYSELRSRLPMPPRLVMVGKPLAPRLLSRIHELGLDDDVMHFANVSGAQLEALYSLADALLFPSWHEGFGWPVAEAQSCGCPVFTSDRAPMTEVGGDAAVYFDPTKPAEAAHRIAEAWPRRPAMSARGLSRASEWSRSRMIDRYVETYRALARLTPETAAA